ncbi:uncharacterized protein LOC135383132 [Ornithodoros turicata]|uniref:uncharacterized protein LOC135383132 n=1 Tax=Ornithodoros turicata TaxID=34597 RepID=UPI0031397C89
MWKILFGMYVLLSAHEAFSVRTRNPHPTQVVSLNKCGWHQEFTNFSVEPCSQNACVLVPGGYYKFNFDAHLENSNVGDQIAVFGYIDGAYEYDQWRMQHFNFNCSYSEGRFPCTLGSNKNVKGFAHVKIDDGFVNGTVRFRFGIYNITTCGDTTFLMKERKFKPGTSV